jgi:hypothetical protein
VPPRLVVPTATETRNFDLGENGLVRLAAVLPPSRLQGQIERKPLLQMRSEAIGHQICLYFASGSIRILETILTWLVFQSFVSGIRFDP